MSESKPRGLIGISRSWRTIGKASAPCNGFWPPLGRADELSESGGVDVLLKFLGRFATASGLSRATNKGVWKPGPCGISALTWCLVACGGNWAWTPR